MEKLAGPHRPFHDFIDNHFANGLSAQDFRRGLATRRESQ
jgi:hypothetical protein